MVYSELVTKKYCLRSVTFVTLPLHTALDFENTPPNQEPLLTRKNGIILNENHDTLHILLYFLFTDCAMMKDFHVIDFLDRAR